MANHVIDDPFELYVPVQRDKKMVNLGIKEVPSALTRVAEYPRKEQP